MPTTPSVDQDMALTAICASIQTYNAYGGGDAFAADPAKFVTAPPGTTYETFWYGQDVFAKEKVHPEVVFGLVFSVDAEPGSFVFAFRGTEGIDEWIDDAKVSHSAFRPFAPGNAPAVPPGASAEHGFEQIYRSMQATLFSLLGTYQPKKVWITGHSLGSALCQLFSLDLAISRPQLDATTYDFAAPRTGNAAFAAFYDRTEAALGRRTVRFVNTLDLVPRLPPAELGFRHVGVCYPLCFEKKRDGLLPDYGLRHCAVNYFRALCRAFGRQRCDCRFDTADLAALDYCTPDPAASGCGD